MNRWVTLLIVCVVSLLLIGVLMSYSVSESYNKDLTEKTKRPATFPKHMRYVVLGATIMFLAGRFDYHRLKDSLIFRLIVLISVVLLALVLHPSLGTEVYGARRWLFGFQPSEPAKFALILLVAVKLSDNRDRIQKFWSGFVPPFLIGCFFAGMVVLEKDVGTPAMMMAAVFSMLFFSGARVRHLGIAALSWLPVAVLLTVLFPHRIARLVSFVDPWAVRDEGGYQLIESLFAFARGGLTGVGAGQGEQKLGFTPFAESDFVFAPIGEEFGLIGTMVVMVLFALFMLSGLMVSVRARDFFGSVLGIGMTSIIGFQAAFVMGVNIGLLPTKGLPLPFISHGGTALLMSLGFAGILVNIGAQGCHGHYSYGKSAVQKQDLNTNAVSAAKTV